MTRYKRQSTTAKLTLTTLACIDQDCRNGNGVIVRCKGVEYGVLQVFSMFGKTRLYCYGGAVLDAAQCTIPKTTLPCLPMIGEYDHALA